jgi:hypothetical protein
MLTEGAFLVGAERIDGRVTRVDVHSRTGGRFRLANPWAGAAVVEYGPGARETVRGDVVVCAMEAGQQIVITPVVR